MYVELPRAQGFPYSYCRVHLHTIKLKYSCRDLFYQSVREETGTSSAVRSRWVLFLQGWMGCVCVRIGFGQLYFSTSVWWMIGESERPCKLPLTKNK